MEEISEACATMPARIDALYEYGERPIPFRREGVDSLVLRSAINLGAKLQPVGSSGYECSIIVSYPT